MAINNDCIILADHEWREDKSHIKRFLTCKPDESKNLYENAGEKGKTLIVRPLAIKTQMKINPIEFN